MTLLKTTGAAIEQAMRAIGRGLRAFVDWNLHGGWRRLGRWVFIEHNEASRFWWWTTLFAWFCWNAVDRTLGITTKPIEPRWVLLMTLLVPVIYATLVVPYFKDWMKARERMRIERTIAATVQSTTYFEVHGVVAASGMSWLTGEQIREAVQNAAMEAAEDFALSSKDNPDNEAKGALTQLSIQQRWVR